MQPPAPVRTTIDIPVSTGTGWKAAVALPDLKSAGYILQVFGRSADAPVGTEVNVAIVRSDSGSSGPAAAAPADEVVFWTMSAPAALVASATEASFVDSPEETGPGIGYATKNGQDRKLWALVNLTTEGGAPAAFTLKLTVDANVVFP